MNIPEKIKVFQIDFTDRKGKKTIWKYNLDKNPSKPIKTIKVKNVYIKSK